MLDVVVTRDCLENHTLPKTWRTGAYGALLEFRGCVRNLHLGHTVVGIEYDAEAAMAETALKEIRKEFLTHNSELQELCILHRIGKLELGETSLIVGLAGAHRKNLFRICDEIIIEIKRKVPIWKKELYSDKSSAWLEGTSLRVLED